MSDYEIHIQETNNPYDPVIVPISSIVELNEQLNDMLQHVGGINYQNESIEDLNKAINNLITNNPITNNLKTVCDIDKKEIEILNIEVIEI